MEISSIRWCRLLACKRPRSMQSISVRQKVRKWQPSSRHIARCGYLVFGIAATLSRPQHPSSRGRFVARTHLPERDTPLDLTFRIRAPAHCIRQGHTPPSTRDAQPRGRGCVYDDRVGSGGFGAQGRGRTGDVSCMAHGYFDRTCDSGGQGTYAVGCAQARVTTETMRGWVMSYVSLFRV